LLETREEEGTWNKDEEEEEEEEEKKRGTNRRNMILTVSNYMLVTL
jgi:hypothetical protein